MPAEKKWQKQKVSNSYSAVILKIMKVAEHTVEMLEISSGLNFIHCFTMINFKILCSTYIVYYLVSFI